MREQKGFSLIELLIVVAIILIILAIAVPSYLRTKMVANETAAVATVRTLSQTQQTYQTKWGVGFAANIAALGNGGGGGTACTESATSACLIDSALSTGNKQGYSFSSNGENGSGTATSPFLDYVTTAFPKAAGTSGNRDFCSTSDNVTRAKQPSTTTGAMNVAACTQIPPMQ